MEKKALEIAQRETLSQDACVTKARALELYRSQGNQYK